MIKRLFDIIVSSLMLVVFSPLLLVVALLVYLQDFKNPLYMPSRVGLRGRSFTMFKMRSMVVNADSSGVDSTSSTDSRITPIGSFIRRFKIDEITQLINVFLGHMSLVGPRPNVQREVDLYTELEFGLLSVKPGITDLSSIVFSDEGDILSHFPDPDLAYNQYIRPYKSSLGLFYIKNHSIYLDIKILFLTVLSFANRNQSLRLLARLLSSLNAPHVLIQVSTRTEPLQPSPPPGALQIVSSRSSV